jgi:hypothetical protein
MGVGKLESVVISPTSPTFSFALRQKQSSFSPPPLTLLVLWRVREGAIGEEGGVKNLPYKLRCLLVNKIKTFLPIEWIFPLI